ncbi:MAG TPA: ferritin, partial [Methanobacteriaceae archaeon]|nr:ferritin [Methanobacteriaceae archaeon]
MLDERMEEALNYQLNRELYSGYLYLAMAAYFDDQDLPGFANWMRIQAQEELSHAMKFYDYLVRRGGRAVMDAIEAPENEWESAVAVFEQVYQHEQMVTGLIHKLVDLALELSDHATNNFLQWFVAEQVEEEESSSGVLHKVKMASQSRSGLYMLDQELG